MPMPPLPNLPLTTAGTGVPEIEGLFPCHTFYHASWRIRAIANSSRCSLAIHNLSDKFTLGVHSGRRSGCIGVGLRFTCIMANTLWESWSC